MRNSIACLCLITACGPTHRNAGDDTGDVDANPLPEPDARACAASAVMAEQYTRPIDIIWVIDNSGSMRAEEQRVQDNMNAFAQSIAASGADYHVIVVSDLSKVNVPPPLGGGPRYLGVNQSIGSTDSLQQLVNKYPAYSAFLRPTSIKHIVVVTDDESDWSKSMFESQLAALTAPGFGTDWRLHAVVAEDPPWNFQSHCFTLAADVGQTYINLQQAHGGTFFSLCSTNWSPLFTTLAQAVVAGTSLPCTFAIPSPPAGMTLDPSKVNFVFTPTGGQPQIIHNVGSMAGCNGGPGWYYDNPQTPTAIVACPATCSTLEADATGKVSVEFGCSTVIL